VRRYVEQGFYDLQDLQEDARNLFFRFPFRWGQNIGRKMTDYAIFAPDDTFLSKQ
jgi:hypothetical protein